jgi:hypothetical protein
MRLPHRRPQREGQRGTGEAFKEQAGLNVSESELKRRPSSQGYSLFGDWESCCLRWRADMADEEWSTGGGVEMGVRMTLELSGRCAGPED